MARFTDKVAIVTGGASGLGEAIAKERASDGAGVVTQAGGSASAFKQDTAGPEQNKATVDFAVEKFGGEQASAGEIDIDDWRRVIDINLVGVLYGIRYQAPEMLEAPHGQRDRQHGLDSRHRGGDRERRLHRIRARGGRADEECRRAIWRGRPPRNPVIGRM